MGGVWEDRRRCWYPRKLENIREETKAMSLLNLPGALPPAHHPAERSWLTVLTPNLPKVLNPQSTGSALLTQQLGWQGGLTHKHTHTHTHTHSTTVIPQMPQGQARVSSDRQTDRQTDKAGWRKARRVARAICESKV